MSRFELTSELSCSAEQAYAWHARAGAFERLTPPWERVRVLERNGTIADGTVVLEMRVGPTRQRWVARHRDAIPGRQFVDEQMEGPFARWVHTHRFAPLGGERTRYTDEIGYTLPGGALGELGAGFVANKLRRNFRYRHATVRDDLAAHQRHAARGALTVAITGATGLLGRNLIAFLTAGGHSVLRIVRGQAGPDDIGWDPAGGRLDAAALEGVDAVIHLAGESIAGSRWSNTQRRRILDSRIQGTTLLAETLARLTHPPKVLVSASAVGIYGDRGDEVVTEETPLHTGPGSMFVEQVGQAWEAATAPADRAGIRVVRTRIGIVLTPAGGALQQMLPPFRMGVGGRLGSGQQYMSWISIDDVVGALHHVLMTESLRGPVNLTAPEPVTNAAFTTTIGKVLGRPTLFPVPAAALRLLLGDIADELLLSGARVVPQRLEQSGYRFRQAALEDALRHLLGR
ncbi:MAG: TIGR01777 family oxidoreductase [Gemmatimonadota bacterium]